MAADFDANWSRWCFASFSKFFNTNRGSVTLYVEGTDRQTSELKDFAEFRMDGPRIKSLGKHLTRLEVTINILCFSTMDDVDAHKLQRTIGVMLAAFQPVITAYKYGDDGTQFACFQRASPSGAKIGFDVRINQFGIIDPVLRIQQATLEATYFAEVET